MFKRTSSRIWGTTSDALRRLVIRDCNSNGDLELHISEPSSSVYSSMMFVIPFKERKNFLRIIADVNPPSDPVPLPDEFGDMIYHVIIKGHVFDGCVRVGCVFISDDGCTIPDEDIMEFEDEDGNTFERQGNEFYEKTR